MTTQAMHIAQGSSAQVRVGFLISYGGNELSSAIADFSKNHSEIELHTEFGTHEELFNSLRSGHCDLVLNDQRRAFSDEYVNHSLASFQAFIAVAEDSPLSARAGICMNELKQHPCILICPKDQMHIEEQFYRSVLNVEGEVLQAASITEGLMMVLSKQGFLMLDGCRLRQSTVPSIVYVPLTYEDGSAVRRNYCLFMRKDNNNESARLLLQSLATRLG